MIDIEPTNPYGILDTIIFFKETKLEIGLSTKNEAPVIKTSPPRMLHTMVFWAKHRVRSRVLAWVATVVCLLSLDYLLFHMDTSSNNDATFSLLVHLQFESQPYLDQFLSDIGPLLEYVEHHEPQTTLYKVMISDKDPLKVMLLERYRNKETAYLQIHKSSKIFQEFRPKLAKLIEEKHVEMQGESYIDYVG